MTTDMQDDLSPEKLASIMFDALVANGGELHYVKQQGGLRQVCLDTYVDLIAVAEKVLAEIRK